MSRWQFWDVVQAVGAVASIVGLIGLLSARPAIGIALASLVLAGVFGVIVASVMSRGAPKRVGRGAMIATGRRLIQNVKQEAIMFGGDMSWAGDYEDAIRAAASRGKTVRVVYPRSNAHKVRHNEQILTDAGAELCPTPADSGLRALLVDPEDPKDALLYVVTRTLRRGAVPVELGEHGSESNYEYVAKVYDMNRDWVIIQAAKKVCSVLLVASPKR